MQKTAFLPDKRYRWNAVFCSFSGFCKAWQAGKLFSAITPMICKVCQTGKQFSAVTLYKCPE
jgi:hypothetical protein